MFAKVFGQIFDSSIAEDYNCRRMFMDLLVLADSDGVVDMTLEAISRRTNVPIEEVRKYIAELQQPDPTSRSKQEEGRRLVAIDSQRGWGWQIVNYAHYRQIRDEEARRSYFRDAKRKLRASQKKKGKRVVLDKAETSVDTSGQLLTPASASASSSVHNNKEPIAKKEFKWPVWSTPEFQERFHKWIRIRRGQGKAPKDWHDMFQEQLIWIEQFEQEAALEILGASIRSNWQGLFPPKQNLSTPRAATKLSAFEIKSRIAAIEEELGKSYWNRDKPEVKARRAELSTKLKEYKKMLTE